MPNGYGGPPATHFCQVVGDGWRPCPEEYCEAGRLVAIVEELQELIEKAAAITSIGHGLSVNEPVNVGSFTWAKAASQTLRELAALREEKANAQ